MASPLFGLSGGVSTSDSYWAVIRNWSSTHCISSYGSISKRHLVHWVTMGVREPGFSIAFLHRDGRNVLCCKKSAFIVKKKKKKVLIPHDMQNPKPQTVSKGSAWNCAFLFAWPFLSRGAGLWLAAFSGHFLCLGYSRSQGPFVPRLRDWELFLQISLQLWVLFHSWEVRGNQVAPGGNLVCHRLSPPGSEEQEASPIPIYTLVIVGTVICSLILGFVLKR